MKKFLTLLAALAFASTATFAQTATPRAAEDPSAPVVASDKPVPKVRKATHPRTKQIQAKRAHGKKAHIKKAGGKRHAKLVKGKHRKARLARR